MYELQASDVALVGGGLGFFAAVGIIDFFADFAAGFGEGVAAARR